MIDSIDEVLIAKRQNRLNRVFNMQIISLLTALILMNLSYVFIYFNMEKIVSQSSDEETIEEVIFSSDSIIDPSSDLGLADLLDLDILDFDVEELIAINEEDDDCTSTCGRRAEDLMTE
jgi:hypothetical protein